mgnify:CR=1 FL=1
MVVVGGVVTGSVLQGSRSTALNRENLMSSFFVRGRDGCTVTGQHGGSRIFRTWRGRSMSFELERRERSQLGESVGGLSMLHVCTINSAKLDRRPGVD